jgi:hypothetical protein
VMWVMWNLVSICFKIVLASVQDRCSVCVKRTIGSLIVLDAPMVLLGHEGLVEIYSVCLKVVLLMTQDRCTFCTKRTIGSKIVLDAPSGTRMWRESCGISF